MGNGNGEESTAMSQYITAVSRLPVQEPLAAILAPSAQALLG